MWNYLSRADEQRIQKSFKHASHLLASNATTLKDTCTPIRQNGIYNNCILFQLIISRLLARHKITRLMLLVRIDTLNTSEKTDYIKRDNGL